MRERELQKERRKGDAIVHDEQEKEEEEEEEEEEEDTEV